MSRDSKWLGDGKPAYRIIDLMEENLCLVGDKIEGFKPPVKFSRQEALLGALDGEHNISFYAGSGEASYFFHEDLVYGACLFVDPYDRGALQRKAWGIHVFGLKGAKSEILCEILYISEPNKGVCRKITLCQPEGSAFYRIIDHEREAVRLNSAIRGIRRLIDILEKPFRQPAETR